MTTPDQRNGLIANTAGILALVLAGAVALFALQLLIAGIPLTVVAELPIEAQPSSGATSVAFQPYPAAVIPLLAMILFTGGLLARKHWIAWAGWGVLGVFALLFLFSSGAALLPAVGVLLILLIIISYGHGRLPQLSPGDNKSLTA